MTQLINLGKLRFAFSGEWDESTVYEFNDVVKYGGNVYVYTYALKTAGHAPTDSAYWALMVEGFKFQGVYNEDASYRVGDGVAFGGKVFVALADNTGIQPTDTNTWSQFADGVQYEGVYDETTIYQKNDIVKYGASAFIAKTDTLNHVPTDGMYWDKLVDGIAASGVWNSGAQYGLNSIVAYGANLYIAIAPNMNQVPAAQDGMVNSDFWQLFNTGLRPMGYWATATVYNINDIVTRGGSTYLATANHASNSFADDLTAGKWSRFSGGIRFRGAWSDSATYFKDDVVLSGTSSYICVLDNTVDGSAPSGGANAAFALLAAGADNAVAKAGDTMSGPLTLPGDPTQPLQAAPKQYVDAKFASTAGRPTFSQYIDLAV